jgi:hypothetical protein
LACGCGVGADTGGGTGVEAAGGGAFTCGVDAGGGF